MSNYAKRPRRIIAGMLAGALALSVTPILGFTGVASAQEVAEPIGAGNFCENVPQSEPFTDVQATDPSYGEIVCLVATEITTGVTATTYEPNSFVTRRQMALFLVRLANEANRLEIGNSIEELPAPADTDFSDTEDEQQFIEDAISQITQAGVAEGFPDNTYRPGAPVSRRQMAAFIDRLYEFLTGAALPNSATDHFADDNSDSAAAQESTNAVAEAGIFIGNEDGTFRPAQEITRRQMANVLTRTLQVLFENGEITKWAAEGAGNQTATARPELVSAAIVQTTSQGTTVRYTFDEALTGTNIVPGNFHVYRFGYMSGGPVDNDAAGSDDNVADFAQVVSGDTRSVLATFTGITASAGASALSVATVENDAVFGLAGASDGNIIGDAPLNPGATTQLTAGVTAAPDLVSVGNFRANPADVNETLVDFTFDEAAFVTGAPVYHLISVDGVTDNDSGVPVAGNGTTVHVLAFQNNQVTPSTVTILPAAIARGTIDAGSVGDATGGTGNLNPLQSADVSNAGNSETPDLVSAVLALNQPNPDVPGTFVDAILYTFDEPVINPTPAGPSTWLSVLFRAYTSGGAEIGGAGAQAIRSTANDTQVVVVFGPAGTLNFAVGASVLDGAVDEGSGAQNRPNQQDEVATANVGTGTTTVSGRTDAPDLIGVAVDERRDPFGTLIGGRVTYSFDEDIVLLDATNLGIALPDGTRYTCTGGGTVGITEDTDHTIRCDVFGVATTTQILSAVVGTVDDGAVNNQVSGTNPGVTGTDTNIEGSEIAT